MYPTAEFRTAARRAANRRAGTIMAAVATAFLGGVTTLYIQERLPLWEDEWRTAYAFLLATAAGVLLTSAFGVAWLQARHRSLHCPHCRSRLTDRVPQVLASGCCHQCGRQVLDRSEEESAEALIPRAEFLAADAKHQQRTGPFMLGAVTATFAGCVVGAALLDRADLPDPLGRILFMLLLLTAPVAMVLVLRWMAAGAKRDPSLACPECVQPLTGAGMLVAGTGHCFHCGGRAVPPRNTPLPPPHAGAWWTVQRLKATDAHRRRITRSAVVLIVAVCVVAIWVLSLGDRLWDDRWLMNLGLSKAAADEVADRAPLLVAVVTVMAAVVVNGAASRRIKKEHPLDCPRCAAEVQPSFAIATKCCNKCGWKVVSDPDAPHGNRSATRTVVVGRASGETASAGPSVRCVR